LSAAPLRKAVWSRIVPALITEDFHPLPQDEDKTQRFVRRESGVIHVLEVQWDRHGRPRYVLNYGTCPVDGLRVGTTHHAADTVYAGWLPDSGRLQPLPGATSAHWFRQDVPLIKRLFGRSTPTPDTVVESTLALLPELWRYWRDGIPGRHMHACPPASPAPLAAD
jgi:hypothetical protein